MEARASLRVHGEPPRMLTVQLRKVELRDLGTVGAWNIRQRRVDPPRRTEAP